MRSVFTDLALERHQMAGEKEREGIELTTERSGAIERTVVKIVTEQAEKTMQRPRGYYVTLSFEQQSQLDLDVRKELADELAKSLRQMLPSEGDVLVVGLGNRRVTADALGPRVVDATLVTRHLRAHLPQSLSERVRPVSAVAPGVLGITGMETAEVVRGIVHHVHPEAVIAVDALAARESGRICSTLQIADTGIAPGSGVGNHRLGLTQNTLGVPVIAIGVPMVVYAATIARDALSYLVQDVQEEGQDQEQVVDALIQRVVTEQLGDLVVTPREVDTLIEHMADIVATGINQALHPQLDPAEISLLMS